VAAALFLTTATALAGSGVHAVFNLGETNTVNGSSVLTGSTSGPQLKVLNANASNHGILAQAGGGTGIALYGQHTSTAGAGPALRADSASSAAGAFSLYALLSSTAPGLNSAAIRAVSNSTGATGYALWASQAGTGSAVYGTSPSGIGVLGRHTGAAGSGPGVEGDSASAATAGVLGKNLAGGPGLQAIVTSNAVSPLKVNSSAKVPNLNADKLDGVDASGFYAAGSTVADSSKLGGFQAATFSRLRTPPTANTLTPLDSTDFTGLNTSSTIGSDGLGLISYHSLGLIGFPQGDLKVAHCSNVACSSASTFTLDQGLFVDRLGSTSVAIGSDGLGLISYYDQLNRNLKVAHCANVACSSASKYTLDATGDVGSYTSVTIGVDGLGLISYYDQTNGNLKVAHCSNVACSSASTHTLASPHFGSGSPDTSITIGADGLGLISYHEEWITPTYIVYGWLNVAHCDNVACSSASTFTVDDGGYLYANVGSDTSVTVGVDGLGLISYRESSAGRLKVAHCENFTCSSATAYTLDSGGDVEFDTSVTIGAGGLGLISYYDQTNGNLKVAHCSNVACSSASTFTVEHHSSGIVGLYTSVTIGQDGLGLISYHDETKGDLKVAHCGSTSCTPYFRRR